MPIWHPNLHGDLVSGVEAEHTGTVLRDMFSIEFPCVSWGSASIHCVFADSKPIAGSFTTHMQGYDTLTGINVTNYYNGPGVFSDNFEWVAGAESIQKLQIKSAGGVTDAIQICCTIVCCSRDDQPDPFVTVAQ